ncbi:MAG: hypothetical protein A2W19_16695 [Spirochaetes bacterium RBG_16_49_21]|nr:MAG: hypothetical protein A2W19_16695 [Spirochaetes bacterium RBG_16_49_21]
MNNLSPANNTVPARVLEILEWPAIQEELRKRCKTQVGQKVVSDLIPLDAVQSRARLKKITHLKEIIGQDAPPDLSGIEDIEPLLALAEKDGMLKLEELVLIKSFTAASARIMRFLKKQKDAHPSLEEEYAKLDRLTQITGVLADSITGAGELNDEAYPELRRIKSELYSARREIEKRIAGIIHSPSAAPALQEKIFTTRNGRFVILVKSAMKDRIKGAVQDISSSGATYYIEPSEVTPLNNRAILLEKEEQVETARILRLLSQSVSRHAEPLLRNLRILGYIDFLCAAALYSADIRGSEPEIADQSEIKLLGARHPILYRLSPDAVVPNDIELGISYRCLIISGTNTGGKTVILKTIGLCALLAMHGLHLPVSPDSRIGIFSSLLADIGDDQSLSESLSTFSGQIVVINRMLAEADEKTLVIIDEIIVGTNPRQGAALARAILESLIETGSRIAVTTHYSELKQLAAADTRFRNASVSFDRDTLRPTYRLMTGLPGVSYAVEIARNYGLPERIISRAHALLESGEAGMDTLVEMIQKQEQEIAEEKLGLAGLFRDLDLEKKEYDERLKILERRAEEIKQKEGIKFLNELADYRRLVAERTAGLQQMSLKQAGSVQNTLREVEDSIRSKLDEDRDKLYADHYAPAAPESLKPGSRVFIPSLEKEGTVERIDHAKKSATVLLGGFLKSTFRFEDLRLAAGSDAVPSLPQKRDAPRPEQGRDDAGGIPPVIQTSYNTVDLRGKRVEEGIRIMDQGFDRMLRQGVDIAVVIHGHGTGAMKEAVRENLRHSLYAADFRAGDRGEGGDGVTIVRLRT